MCCAVCMCVIDRSIDSINSDIMFSYVSRNREMFHNEVVIKIAKLRIIAQTGKSFEMMIWNKFTYSWLVLLLLVGCCGSCWFAIN